MCDHTKTIMIEDGIKKCLLCEEEFCIHSKIDHDSTCMDCGEYVTEVSMDKPWNDSTFSSTNQTVKNVGQYINYLETLGYSSDIVQATMEKFTKVGCGSADEKNLLAACVWMAHYDLGIPRTMIEIAKKHGISKSKIKKGRSIAVTYYEEYVTKYITVSMIIKKLLLDLGIDYDTYYEEIYNMSKFIEENWEKSVNTKRSAPQNIASACVFLYISQSPTLKHMVDTPTKKKQVCKIMGPSSITIDKICKHLKEEFIE